jgi:hypothetical protein
VLQASPAATPSGPAGGQATALLRVFDDGSLAVAVVGETAWSASVGRVVLRRGAAGSDGAELATLVPDAGWFDATTRLAETQAGVSAAEAGELVTTPSDFHVSVLDTSDTEILRGQLRALQPVAGSAVLTGLDLVPAGAPDARAALTVQVDGNGQADVVLASAKPDVSELDTVELHAGASGENGDLLASLPLTDAGAPDLREGSTQLGLGVLARLLQAPSSYHVLVASASGPAARGQLSVQRPQLWAAPTPDGTLGPRGSAERAGVTLDFTSFDQVRATVAAEPQIGIGQVLGVRISQGAGAASDPTVLDLDAALGAKDPNTDSSSGVAASQRETLTRVLADPGAYSACVTYAPVAGGTETLVAPLSTNPLRFHTDLTDAAGAVDLTVDSVQGGRYTYVMADPVVADVTGGHLYDGDPGSGGAVVEDLLDQRETPATGTNLIAGPLDLGDAGLARLLATPEGFSVDYQTALDPIVPASPLEPGVECSAGHAPPIEGAWSGAFHDAALGNAFDGTITDTVNLNPEGAIRTFTDVPLACTDIDMPAVTVTETAGDVTYAAHGQYAGTDVSFTMSQTSLGATGDLDGRTFTGTFFDDETGLHVQGTTAGGNLTVQMDRGNFRAVFGGIWVAEDDPEHVLRFEVDDGTGFVNNYVPVDVDPSSDPYPVSGAEVVHGTIVRKIDGTFDGTVIDVFPTVDFEGVPSKPGVSATFAHANRIVWTPAGGQPTVFLRSGS